MGCNGMGWDMQDLAARDAANHFFVSTTIPPFRGGDVTCRDVMCYDVMRSVAG